MELNDRPEKSGRQDEAARKWRQNQVKYGSKKSEKSNQNKNVYAREFFSFGATFKKLPSHILGMYFDCFSAHEKEK
ncbi:hypothetical protein [Porphyromonas gulae]|uniref:hypothetical protein n=1 Tax=Porphyromonas gulae TaxID=111105 RepID=UPI00052C6082|nr:hypothetical protein [Porphyromonas gulae]KGN91372.1 hypothetical protein HQ46_01955 [Porphyromonas gulae]